MMSDFDQFFTALQRVGKVLDIGAVLSLGPRITGIEVTQGIQYHGSSNHLTDSRDRGNDNAVQLVGHKPALVRVYVAPRFGVARDDPVLGTLEVARRASFADPYESVVTLNPWWTGATRPQDDSYDDERRNVWRSLNFLIPAADFVGSLRLTARLDTGHSSSVSVEVLLVQTLRVRVFPVRYRGPDTASPPAGTMATELDLPAPTLADALTTAADAFRAMPVQETGSFALAAQVNLPYPLDDARQGAGGCSDNWDSFLRLLDLVRDADGNRADVVYYGLLPADMPVNVPGCGRRGVGAGRVNDTMMFLHEIGHGYGFMHTPSGAVGTADPDYPDYEPYFSASIGEYGVDIDTGAVYSPATSTDYMSYGPSPWMSLYQHERLIGHPRLAPRWISLPNPFLDVPKEYSPEYEWWPDPPWEADHLDRYRMRPLISVHGTITARGVAHVDSVARVNMNPTLTGQVTNWAVELVGRSGEVSSRGLVTRSQPLGHHECGCASGPGGQDPNQPPFNFHALLPDREYGQELRLIDPHGETTWQRHAPAVAPRFSHVAADTDGEVVYLRWALDDEVTPQDVWAQWSADQQLWHAIAVGLGEGNAEIAVAGLPAGALSIRLLAHDGFSTSTSESVQIEIPKTAPQLAVLFPEDGQRVPADVEFHTRGAAVAQSGGPIASERLTWLLDNEPIGTGRSATVRAGAGEHRLTLQATSDSDASVTVVIHAHSRGQESDQST